MNEWNITEDNIRPTQIFVDVIGMGAGVVDRLLELGLPAVGINVAESPMILQDNVFRLRDELWMNGLRWFETRAVKIVNHPPLIRELTAVRKGFTSSGKMRVESKDDMKKRLLRSPDVADAFNLTFAYGAGVMTGAVSKTDWSKPIVRESAGNVI